jgi:hypothetical protein
MASNYQAPVVGSSLPRARRSVRIVVALLTLAFIASATAAAYSTYQGWRSQSFIQAEGVITGNDVSRSRRRTGESRRRRDRASYFHVEYEYTLNGQRYVGDRIEAGTFGLTRGDDLKRFGSQFPIGKQVPVFVDPADPQTAVLVRGRSGISTLLYVLTGFLAFTLMLLNAIFRAGPVTVSSTVNGRPVN